MRRFIVSKEARARRSLVGLKACIVRCSDSGFSLKKSFYWQHCWEILLSYIIETCRSLSVKYDGKLGDWISRAFDSSRRRTWREDEPLLFTPQDHRGLLQIPACWKMIWKWENVMPCCPWTCMSRKWMWIWPLASKNIYNIHTFSSYFADEVYRLGKEYGMFFHSFIAWNAYALFFFLPSLAWLMHLGHL